MPIYRLSHRPQMRLTSAVSRARFFIGGKKSLREADVGAVGERVVHFETPPTPEENPLRRKMGVQTVRNIILTCEKQP